jgi:hypothetical protein
MNRETRRAHRRRVWRVLGWVTVLALFAFTFARSFAFARTDAPAAGFTPRAGVARDATPRFGHDRGFDAVAVRGLRLQPASRSRASTLTILTLGVVVAALAHRELRFGARTLARAFRLPGLRSGRGPPVARIA